jgi:hypothetical protein
MKYIAKPSLFNNNGVKEFADAKEAVDYLNKMLSSEMVDPSLDYVYITPKSSPKQLKKSVEEYAWIGKLMCIE